MQGYPVRLFRFAFSGPPCPVPPYPVPPYPGLPGIGSCCVVRSRGQNYTHAMSAVSYPGETASSSGLYCVMSIIHLDIRAALSIFVDKHCAKRRLVTGYKYICQA